MKRPCGVFLSESDDVGDARRMPISLPASGCRAIAHSGDSQRVSLRASPCRANRNDNGPLVWGRAGQIAAAMSGS